MYGKLDTPNAVILNTLTGLLKSNLDQPASDDSGNTFLFLEGEVFNLQELRKHLQSPTATSPCSVLLSLFMRYGEKFVSYVNGEFNIVIFQKTANRLMIFTDHVASMPMYYMEEQNRLLFASEKKYILSLLDSSPTIDSVGLLQIFAHRYNLDERTFLRGLNRMLPSTRLIFQTGRMDVARYQLLKFEVPEQARGTSELVENWSEQLKDATQLRLDGKDRVQISLSGGLDSRAIAAAIPRHFRPVGSRTSGLDTSPDVIVAAQIAHKLEFDHLQESPSGIPYSQILAKIVWRTECETHFTNATSIANHAESKQRGDFIAGGWLGDVSSGGHISPQLFFAKDRHAFIERVFDKHQLFRERWLQKVFTPEFLQQSLPRLSEEFQSSFSYLEGDSNIQVYEIWDLYQRQRRQTTSSMPVDSYLFEKIRPFYDKNYLNFTLTLPTHLRFGQILYQSMIYELGPEIRDIPSANNMLRIHGSLTGNIWNKGLTLANRAFGRAAARLNLSNTDSLEPQTLDEPAVRIRKDPAFRAIIEQYLSSHDFDAAIFNRDGIRRLLKEHYDGASDHSYLLGYVAMFSVGLPYFLGRTRRCPPEAEPAGV